MAASEVPLSAAQPVVRPVTESQAHSTAGIPVLCLAILGLAAGTALVIWGIVAHNPALAVIGIVLYPVSDIGFHGLTAVVPGEARVLQLFGAYRGTVRTAGLRWVNPFTRRRRVSTRVRNHETPVAKVNDADGNPIEIAAVVVWQVSDTAKATYAVDDYPKFVATQTETAVRHVASSYPYDSR
ncbi:MAG: SPFH domain-containing protein, partial [Actinobacteria bacterium]|nr:SPFH domain-containing protein [Actinomycetota bacterium]